MMVVRTESKSRHEQSGNAYLFDGEDELEPFSPSQIERLRRRLSLHGFTETMLRNTQSEFVHPSNGVSALMTGKGLYFRAAFAQASVFEASMIASELTDTGDFAKYDPQAGGWEVTPNEEDLFQYWLIDMDDAIERFRDSLPANIAEQLDFTPDSLNVIEAYILERYAAFDDIKKPSEAYAADAMARYVGEVFRKNFGGKWIIDYADKKNVFFGLPQLRGMAGQRAQMCPRALVTASTGRRSGNFFRKIFDNQSEDAAGSRPGAAHSRPT